VLTDQGLYAFKDLAVRFLRDEAINHSSVQYLDLEAVDASLGPDRSLLVVMSDSVYHVKIDSILAGGEEILPTVSDDESWEPDEKIPWEQSEELELTEVA
jgi:hypothetical protein